MSLTFNIGASSTMSVEFYTVYDNTSIYIKHWLKFPTYFSIVLKRSVIRKKNFYSVKHKIMDHFVKFVTF